MASVKKNYLYETVYQILILIIPFLVSPYISRVLKAEGVGIYSYTNAVVTYFTMLATLGIRNYGGRMIARCENEMERSRLFWSILDAHFIVSGLSILFYCGYVIWFAEYQLIAWIQGLNVLAALVDISWFFTGMENFKILTVRSAIIKIVTCISVFCFVKDAQHVVNYVVIMSVGTLGNALILLPYARRYICWVKPHWSDVRKHFKPLLVLAIPTFLTTVYTTVDKIVLGMVSGNKEVAYYENSEKVLIVRNFIYSVGTVMLPRISSLYARKEYDKIRNYIQKSTEMSLIMCYAFMFGLIACSKEFAPWFWGEEFAICGYLIVYVAIMMFFNTIANTIRSLYLIPMNRDRQFVMAATVSAISNVILDIVLIPLFNAAGAWMATLLSSICACVYQMWVVRKELSMVTYCFRTVYYFVIGIIMLLVCRVVSVISEVYIVKLVLEIGVGALIYVGGCYLYWKKTNQLEYLNMIKGVLHRGKK